MQNARASYRPTESKYKGGAHEMYVTYALEQQTHTGAVYPKVKRVYIAGEVVAWKAGMVKKRSGRAVHGVLISEPHAIPPQGLYRQPRRNPL